MRGKNSKVKSSLGAEKSMGSLPAQPAALTPRCCRSCAPRCKEQQDFVCVLVSWQALACCQSSRFYLVAWGSLAGQSVVAWGRKAVLVAGGTSGAPSPLGDWAAGSWRLPRASLQLCLPPVQKQNRPSISQDTLTALFLQMLPPLLRTVWGRASCFRAVRVLPAATCFGCSPSCTHLWEAGLQRAPLLPAALEL